MRVAWICGILLFSAGTALGGEIIVEQVRGEVFVREGVGESWKPARIHERLRPHDSMMTGEDGSAVLLVTDEGAKKIHLPAGVIIDLSDFRTLTRDELILKLTMERVKAAPYEWKSNDLQIPNATVVHGSGASGSEPNGDGDLEMARLQMNGAHLLYNTGYFSTCALKGLSLLGRFPSLGESFDNRFMVAESLERSNLPGEALSEYTSLSTLPGLTEDQENRVRGKIAEIKGEK
ncbi:MAG: hypothetical protein OEV30_12790 [Ignavibacteria bacterium]|nr:hypothetical protein [Ignavibacteria bacterium]